MEFSAFLAFVRLGFDHITEPGALDHIVFLLALAAIYRFREWRNAVIVVSAFTVGHSATLALAVLQPAVLPPPAIVEFLIPLTILATGIENIASRGVSERPVRSRLRVVLAGSFGLVHGAGFAGYLEELFVDSIAMPLLGFNIGIEVGQVAVLAAAFILLAAIDRALSALTRGRDALGLRVRVVGVSCAVGVFGAVWAVQRVPW